MPDPRFNVHSRVVAVRSVDTQAIYVPINCRFEVVALRWLDRDGNPSASGKMHVGLAPTRPEGSSLDFEPGPDGLLWAGPYLDLTLADLALDGP